MAKAPNRTGPSSAEKKTIAKGNAKADALRDMERTFSSDRTLGSANDASEKARTVAGGARIARAASNYTGDLKPLSPRQEGLMKGAQEKFERSKNPVDKEGARRTIGRLMQSGVASYQGYSRLACQTPNCDKSVDLAATSGDVVCSDCISKGDPAGKEYRDVPKGNTSSARTLK